MINNEIRLFERRIMLIEREPIQLLIDLGFTKNQARLYLALLRVEEANGRTLSENTNIPRPEVYRTLGELEKKGFVEREIATPYKFKPTPLNVGLEILMNQQIEQFKEIKERTEVFLQKIQNIRKETPQKQEYKLTKIKGRQRLIQLIKFQHDTVQQKADVLSTLQRWMQILYFCFENYKRALARGVKYRVVIEAADSEIMSHENIKALLKEPNFELRLTRGSLRTNAAIFDQNELTISFFPAVSLGESPLIWTNHPSLMSMYQDHFEAIWKTARKCKLVKKDENELNKQKNITQI
jgi:sugar-specific transcriptional regulator TrmB